MHPRQGKGECVKRGSSRALGDGFGWCRGSCWGRGNRAERLEGTGGLKVSLEVAILESLPGIQAKQFSIPILIKP